MSRVPPVAALALSILLSACGSSTPPLEYPPQPDFGEGEHREPAAEQREPLADAPRLVARPSQSPIVTIRVVFDAGSAEDPTGREGITGLVLRLMAEGGAGELSYGELTERLFPMAASIGFSVDRDQSVLVGRVHRDHLADFYAIFRDVFLRPRMAEDDFSRVRAQAQNALTLELRGNDDEELGKEMLQAMLYEGRPYGHPALGTETGLARVTLDDVRAQRSRVLCGGRATVGVAGALPEGFAERVRADVASLTSSACVGRLVLPAVPAIAAPRIWIVDKPEADSVAISMGMPVDSVRGTTDYAALTLAAAYLGQHRQFAGRLMQKMRGDRGLNYGDYAYAEHFEQDGWSTYPDPNVARRQQYFSIWIRPVEPQNAQFALRMAVRELRELVEHGLTQADFERVRAYIESYYALFLQTESRRLGFAIDDTFYGQSQPWLEALRASLRSLTVEQVNAAIRAHWHPAELQIAMVAPNAAELAAAIAADGPSPIQYPAEKPPEILAEDRVIQAYPVAIPRDHIRIVPLVETFH